MTEQTQVYYCEPKDFNKTLAEFAEFGNFCRSRALRRRAYIRYLE